MLIGIALPAEAATTASMTSPAPGSTLPGASVSFSWDAGSGVSEYWIHIGNTSGGADLYNHTLGAALSTTVSALPTDGRTIYVRLWSLVGFTWQFNDYIYTAGSGGVAALSSPTPGSTLPGSSVTFGWSAGTGVSQYWLYIGTTSGGTDLYNQTQGTSRSKTVNELPTDGRTLYVRLWSLVGSIWLYHDYIYTAGTGGHAAGLTTPAPGSTLPGSSVTFGWNSGSGVTQYWLFIGTTPGGADLYNQTQGTSVLTTVSDLPIDGRTIYVRLWSWIGTWQFNDYTYTAGSTGLKAALTTPAPGSTLPGTSAAFGWNTGSGVSQYWLFIGMTPGGADLYNQTQGTSVSTTVSGLPTDGRTLYVRLWSLIGSSWQFSDYTYTAGTVSAQKAAITTPAPGSTLSGAAVSFGWNTGGGVSQYWLYVGTTAGGRELYNQSQGTGRSTTVNGLPTDGRTVYVRLWSLIGSAWQFGDYTYTAGTAAVQGFMSSPLACGDPHCAFTYSLGVYTPGIITTVLDHSLQQNGNGYWQYGKRSTGGGDGVVIAFNGEIANGISSSDETCVGGTILLSSMVVNPGPCGAGYTSYDEHPGYDYRASCTLDSTTRKCKPGTGTQVKSVAAGTVINIAGERCYKSNISGTCDSWGYIGIDHGNGYISQYGHLDLTTISVSAGATVAQGQVIGYSGNTSPASTTSAQLGPHLHFEVLKVVSGQYLVVDPYGWVGTGSDPLYSATRGAAPTKLW